MTDGGAATLTANPLLLLLLPGLSRLAVAAGDAAWGAGAGLPLGGRTPSDMRLSSESMPLLREKRATGLRRRGRSGGGSSLKRVGLDRHSTAKNASVPRLDEVLTR